MDKYDTRDKLKQSGKKFESCFGKECLVRAGTVLWIHNMLSTSIESYDDKIVITMRLIDVRGS